MNNERDLYREFNKAFPEVMKEMGLTPDKLGIETDRSHGSMWDINPESRHKWHKIRIVSNCVECKKMFIGDLILNKDKLDVADTKGFMLFDIGTVCRSCADI